MNEKFISQQWSNIILPKDDKIKLYKIDEIFDKGLKFDVVSITISAVLIFTAFILKFPHGINEWTFKMFEIIAIFISVYGNNSAATADAPGDDITTFDIAGQCT